MIPKTPSAGVLSWLNSSSGGLNKDLNEECTELIIIMPYCNPALALPLGSNLEIENKYYVQHSVN